MGPVSCCKALYQGFSSLYVVLQAGPCNYMCIDSQHNIQSEPFLHIWHFLSSSCSKQNQPDFNSDNDTDPCAHLRPELLISSPNPPIFRSLRTPMTRTAYFIPKSTNLQSTSIPNSGHLPQPFQQSMLTSAKAKTLLCLPRGNPSVCNP